MKALIAGASLALFSSMMSVFAQEKPAPPATTPAPPAAAQATAEALVGQIDELLSADDQNTEDEKVIAAFWTKQLVKVDALMTDFRTRFATDPLRWRVLILEANAREIREELKLPMPKGSRPSAEIYAEIIAAPDADPAMKSEASSARLVSLTDDVAEKKLSVADWEKQYAAHMKAFPEGTENLLLVEMRLLIVEEHANARLMPLLEELSKSPNPEIAQLAGTRLAAAKMLAELKSKPLELKFKALDGTEVDLSKLRGKVVLVDFWATWCGPCMAELPTVLKAYETYKAKGFDIIGISLDEEEADLTRVVKSRKIGWPQYFDGKGWENPHAKKYGIEGIPTMWLVNKAGMVIDTAAQEGLIEKIEKLLKE